MAHITIIRASYVTSQHSYACEYAAPLGPAYVAAALEQAGHEVTLVDSLGEAPSNRYPTSHPGIVAYGLTIPEIVRRIPEGTQGIGLSVMFSMQWPHAEALVRAIHARFPDVPLFVGGEHATATWEYLLTTVPEIALCVLGEGELTAVELGEWLDGKRSVDGISGIARLQDGVPRRSTARRRERNPERLPWPAWHLVPMSAYTTGAASHGYGINRGRTLPLLATRGCPFQCTFCSSPAMWTTSYRVRPVEDVVDELQSNVERFGISNVEFDDLTAFIKRDWVLALCREVEQRGLRLTFQLPSGTRSEVLDREVLTALYRIGCRNISYAPESGSLRTLERIKKRVNLDRMVESIRAAIDVGLHVKAHLIIGFPFEDRRDVRDTLEFCVRLAKLGVEDLPIFPYVPYPGTEIYNELRREGALPPLSNDYFASLTFTDVAIASGVCRTMGPFEIGAYRTSGMALAMAAGYATHPVRALRTLKNIATGRHETHTERRLAGVFRAPDGLLGSARAT